MSKVMVSTKSAVLIEKALDVLEAHAEGKILASPRARAVPRYLHTGEEVKSVEEAAAVMNVDDETAALYVMESNTPLHVQLKEDAEVFLESKVVRHVRTPAGQRRFDQPIGSIIVRDGESPLNNIRVVGKNGDWMLVEGQDGTRYDAGYDSDNGVWVATGENDWDNVIVDDAESQEDMYRLLDSAIGAGKNSKRNRALTPERDRELLESLKKPKAKPAKRGTFHQGPNSANSSLPKSGGTPKAGAGSGGTRRARGGQQTPNKPTSRSTGSASNSEHTGDHERFDLGGGASITVAKGKDGTWYTRKHTGRVGPRGTLYHHVKKFTTHEEALAHAKREAGEA